MEKEDSRVGIRDVSTTPSAKVPTDKFARASASVNVQPSDSANTHCSNAAQNVHKTIFVSSFSFKMTCSTLFATHSTLKLSDTPLVFFHSRRHSRQNTNIRGQTHRWCSLINRQFPLCWTWHTISQKGGHSTLRTSHSDLAQDVANKLIHGGFTYLFVKFLITLFKVWLICLPGMTSACILKDTLTISFLNRNPWTSYLYY